MRINLPPRPENVFSPPEKPYTFVPTDWLPEYTFMILTAPRASLLRPSLPCLVTWLRYLPYTTPRAFLTSPHTGTPMVSPFRRTAPHLTPPPSSTNLLLPFFLRPGWLKGKVEPSAFLRPPPCPPRYSSPIL